MSLMIRGKKDDIKISFSKKKRNTSSKKRKDYNQRREGFFYQVHIDLFSQRKDDLNVFSPARGAGYPEGGRPGVVSVINVYPRAGQKAGDGARSPSLANDYEGAVTACVGGVDICSGMGQQEAQYLRQAGVLGG